MTIARKKRGRTPFPGKGVRLLFLLRAGRRRSPELLLQLMEERLSGERDRHEPDLVDAVVEVFQRALLIELAHFLEVVLAQQHPLEVPDRRRGGVAAAG